MKITIYMEPVPKGRPRATTRGGRTYVYSPKATVHAEDHIREAVLGEKMFWPAGVAVKMKATFYRYKPKSTPRKVLFPTVKPDLANYFALLCDALEKFIYDNDSQITDARILKRYGTPPRIELEIVQDEE